MRGSSTPFQLRCSARFKSQVTSNNNGDSNRNRNSNSNSNSNGGGVKVVAFKEASPEKLVVRG
jgi:hypothetical protein